MWCSEYSKYTVQLVCSSPGYEHNFNTYPASEITNFGVTYDYGSVMHYGAYGFSVNGLPTIVPLVRQIYVYFLLSTCGIPDRICGFLLTPADNIKTQNRKERQVVQRPMFIPRSVCLVFMVVEWQWYRFVWVLQLSVASISLPMYRCLLVICH